MRKLFNIPAERETRLWNKYMSNTYEQLSKLDNTVQDAGLYQGQVGGPRPCQQASPPTVCGQISSGSEHVRSEVFCIFLIWFPFHSGASN